MAGQAAVTALILQSAGARITQWRTVMMLMMCQGSAECGCGCGCCWFSRNAGDYSSLVTARSLSIETRYPKDLCDLTGFAQTLQRDSPANNRRRLSRLDAVRMKKPLVV
ncbi:hypothetical protein F5Y10DRAFT_232587 [Nemania abortiva]|nr:hypothetical protein F5Y10DRAFT_232587 [Nemania abortiva]